MCATITDRHRWRWCSDAETDVALPVTGWFGVPERSAHGVAVWRNVSAASCVFIQTSHDMPLFGDPGDCSRYVPSSAVWNWAWTFMLWWWCSPLGHEHICCIDGKYLLYFPFCPGHELIENRVTKNILRVVSVPNLGSWHRNEDLRLRSLAKASACGVMFWLVAPTTKTQIVMCPLAHQWNYCTVYNSFCPAVMQLGILALFGWEWGR
jgi:hypothetical protein